MHRPPPPYSGYRWETGEGLAAIERYSRDWNLLAHGGSLSPTADAIWMGAFWKAFAERDAELVVHVLREGDRLLAVLPLRRKGRFASGWYSIRNSEWPFWMFCIDEHRAGVEEAILNHLLSDADYLDFGPLHFRGPLYAALRHAATARGLRVVTTERGEDAGIELLPCWDDFCRSLPPQLEQKGATRKQRQLERQGLSFERVTAPRDLPQLLEDCYALEAKGWKGVRGAPIRSGPRTHAFYTKLALAEAAAGRFTLYLLKVGGRLAAFEYCLRAQGRIDLLKPSFDPELAKFSPGSVLRWLILRHEVEAGEMTGYHLGRLSPWKTQWVTRVEPLVRLRIYRASWRGRLAYEGGPHLRALMKRLPGVPRL